jgi:hypothetical protein
MGMSVLLRAKAKMKPIIVEKVAVKVPKRRLLRKLCLSHQEFRTCL